ncbi:hypothetical protein GWK47_035951 [Chionoecetes opilio]|uniref:Uncharacterized protein n=1 Tax=Chionoecetes opilio TaxID=41210 RepID=A0A8J4YG87_CHIOP|nr:hypothetical protein GWK47_035951 [Chionoecetes opilio]
MTLYGHPRPLLFPLPILSTFSEEWQANTENCDRRVCLLVLSRSRRQYDQACPPPTQAVCRPDRPCSEDPHHTAGQGWCYGLRHDQGIRGASSLWARLVANRRFPASDPFQPS